MTEIILVRHGETAWNVSEVFRGRIDVTLNKNGVRQAELLAKYLSDTKIDAVYSSPLQRALKTAALIAGYHQLDVEVAQGLIDLDYGKWQGLPKEEVKERYSVLYSQWTATPQRVTMPEGESLDDVGKRATGVINEVLARYDGTVVLVSHRVVNKVLICALLGLDNSHFWNIRQDTCGMTTFTYEQGQPVLTGHNNTSYLKPLLPKAPPGDF